MHKIVDMNVKRQSIYTAPEIIDAQCNILAKLKKSIQKESLTEDLLSAIHHFDSGLF